MPWRCDACDGGNPAGTRFCGHCGTPAASNAPGEAAAREPVAPPAAGAASRKGTAADDSRPADERRLVTALFADISGFTTLADKLDPDELHEIVSPLISRLAGVAERYEGTIAKYAGDALLVFFGAPVAYEDHAVRALLVAMEMHREIVKAVLGLPLEAAGLQLHIGVNSGHVIAGMFGGEIDADYSILGDAVNMAQRLESVAPPGETYAGETVVDLTRGRFEFESLGGLKLKGKDKPLPAWRLIGEKTAAGWSPERVAGGALVGRETEVADISKVVTTLVREGRGGVLTVVGDPGVGKSALLEEIKGLPDARRAQWLQARCVSYGSTLPYWPYADLVRRYASGGSEDEDAMAASLERLGLRPSLPFFRRLIGLTTGNDPEDAAVADLEPEAFRRGLHEALVSWFEAMAREAPVVLVIEDIHWADASTIALSKHLVRLCPRTRMLVYLTARPDAARLVDEVSCEAENCQHRAVVLGPLDDDGVRRLVEGTLAGPTPAGFVDIVAERSAGNPFFAQEMLHALLEDGTLFREGGTWQIAEEWDVEAVPPTVEGVLSARIDRLSKPAAGLLQTAAVIGRVVRMPLLRALCEDVEDLPVLLDRLVEGTFLDRSDSAEEEALVFHHALILDVAYSRLMRRHRKELHRRVAEVGERIYGAGDDLIDFLARHYYLAEAGAKAVDYLVRAGDRARRLFASEEAVLQFSRAAEVARTDGTGLLPDVLFDLGDLNEQLGRYEEALKIYAEMRVASGDLRAWRGLASTYRHRGEYAEAAAVIDEAFEAADRSGGDKAPLWLERSWSLGLAGRLTDAIQALEAGLAAAGDRSDAVAGQLLLELTRLLTLVHRYDDAMTHVGHAREILETLEDHIGLTKALRLTGDLLRFTGRLDEAVPALERALELAGRTGKAEEIGACLLTLGMVQMERGHLEEAIACDQRAIEVSERIGAASGRAVGYANLAEKLMLHGDLAEALRYCEKGLEFAKRIGLRWVVADATQTLASIRLRQGKLGEAVTCAERAAQRFEEMGASPRAAQALAIGIEALEKNGERERAEEMLARSRSLAAASD